MKIIKKQKGMTLLELMIALSLGVIVVAMLLKMFDGSHINYRTVSALNEIEENAAFATRFMKDELKKAGYKAIPDVAEGRSWAKTAQRAGVININRFDPNATDPGSYPFAAAIVEQDKDLSHLGLDDEYEYDAHEVTVYYMGDDETDVTTCGGTAVPYGAIGYSRFFIQPSNANDEGFDLMCEGGIVNPTNPDNPIDQNFVTIIDGGVGEMSLRYLVDINQSNIGCIGLAGGVPTSPGSTMQAYLTAEELYSDDCNINGVLLNKIRAVVVELDLISTKANISTRGVNQADGTAEQNATGRIGRQVVFTVNMENSLL